jgi:hypothetical protein
MKIKRKRKRKRKNAEDPVTPLPQFFGAGPCREGEAR